MKLLALKIHMLSLVTLLLFPTGLMALTYTWIGSVNGNWNNAPNWDQSAVPGPGDDVLFSGAPLNNCTVNASANVLSVQVAGSYVGTVSIAPSLTLSTNQFSQANGTFNVGGGSLTVNGPFTQTGGTFVAATGSMQLGGNFTISAGTFVHNNGTLNFTGLSSQTIAPGSFTLNHIQISASGGTVTLVGTWNVAGNWTYSSGTVNPGSSTVNLVGANQSINGNNNFFNLYHVAPALATLSLGGTVTVSGYLYLEGAPGSLLTLNSSANGVQRSLNSTGTCTLDYLSVKDSNAVTPLTDLDGFDGGNNTGWTFVASTATPTWTPTPTPTPTPTFSPTAVAACSFATNEAADWALGQADLNSGMPNGGGSPAANTMSNPQDAIAAGGKLFVGETTNNRILIWNSIPAAYGVPADVVVGQPNMSTNTATVGPGSLTIPWAIYSDGARLFICDSSNHRVLIYNSIPTSNGASANRVLGQASFGGALSNRGGSVSGNTLYDPRGIYYDGTKLYVADSANNRVLIWNSLPTTDGQTADLVLGQTGFSLSAANRGSTPTAASLNSPRGILVLGSKLYVVDSGNNRVLIWNTVPTVSGTAANVEIGQFNFSGSAPNSGAGVSASGFDIPERIWADASNRLYVSDASNSRILGYFNPPSVNNVAADFVIGQPNMSSNAINQGGAVTEHSLSEPGGAFAYNGDLYIADWGNHRVNIYDCSFIPTPTATATPLCAGGGTLGYQAIGVNSGTATSLIEASRVTVPTGQIATRIHIYLDSAFGNFVVGLYDDNLGDPGNRLSVSSPQAAVLGWNTVDIPDASIGAGTYWLAVNAASTSTSFRYDNGVTGDESYANTIYNGSLPLSYSGGSTGPWKISMYMDTCPSGPTTPTPTVTPSCPGAGTVGKNVQGASTFANSGYLDASRYWVTGTANAVGLNIYLTVAGNYNLSLYSDSGGGSPVPVSRIAQTGDQIGKLGWNSTPISLTPVSGFIWIAHQVASPASVAYDNLGGGDYYLTYSYGLNPGVFPVGGTPATYQWSMFIDTCPLPTPTPTSTRTPTGTRTATISPTFSFSSTPSPTATPTRTVSPTFSSTFTPSSTATPSSTSTVTLTTSPTITASSTASPSFSSTGTPTFSSTITLTVTPSSTASPTFSQTPTATPSATPSFTVTVSPTFSGTVTLTHSASSTVTPTFSATPTFSVTGTSTSSGTATLTVTLTASPTPSSSPSFSRTATPTSTHTVTLTVTLTMTPSPTPSNTFSATSTGTGTPSSSVTATPNGTFTSTSTFSATPTRSVTLTSTSSPSPSLSSTPSFSATPSRTGSATPSASATRTGSATFTPSVSTTPVLSATDTPTRSATPSASPSFSASPTATAQATSGPSPTVTSTWTNIDTPLPTQTAVVPAVLDHNVFHPGKDAPLDIAFKAPQTSRVTVKVFNLAGEQVRRPFAADVPAGQWVHCPWDGRNETGENVGSGVYLVSVQGAGINRIMKVVLIR